MKNTTKAAIIEGVAGVAGVAACVGILVLAPELFVGSVVATAVSGGFYSCAILSGQLIKRRLTKVVSESMA